MVSLSLSDEIESLLITVWNYREMTEQIKLTLGDGWRIVGQTLEDPEENLSTRRTEFRQYNLQDGEFWFFVKAVDTVDILRAEELKQQRGYLREIAEDVCYLGMETLTFRA